MTKSRTTRAVFAVLALMATSTAFGEEASAEATYGIASPRLITVSNLYTNSIDAESTTLVGGGGVKLEFLRLVAGSRFAFDPIKTPMFVSSAPTFDAGAKIALDSSYANVSVGRIVLMTYGGSATIPPGLFDESSVAAGAACSLGEEPAPDGTNRQLVLTVGDYEHDAKEIRILVIGDSITQGYSKKRDGVSQVTQYRTGMAAWLAANGYRPKLLGHWWICDADAADVAQPRDWAWHSGVSGNAIVTGRSYGGVRDNLHLFMDIAGHPDVVTLLIGTNDIGSQGRTGAATYELYKSLVSEIARLCPESKIVASTILPRSTCKAEVQSFNSLLLADLAAGGVLPRSLVCTNLYAALPQPVSNNDVYYFDGLHPTRRGASLISRGFAAKIMETLPIDSFRPRPDPDGTDEPQSALGAAATVPGDYLADMKHVFTIDIKSDKNVFSGVSPYTATNFAIPLGRAVSKAGYYMELVRKGTSRRRFVWVDFDAEERTLDEVDFPWRGGNLDFVVEKLHVYSNSPGVHNIPPDEDGVRGVVEGTWHNYVGGDDSTSEFVPADVMKHGSGYGDAFGWNDTLRTNGTGYACFQAHRIFSQTGTDRHWNNAEVLFAWNNWGQRSNYKVCDDIGIGTFADGRDDSYKSMDYTYTALTSTGTDYGREQMLGARAYSVRHIEIWAQPAPTTVTVTFNANGGEGGKTVTQNYGTALSAPTVTRKGYTFDGWSPVVPATVLVGDVTYTAQWKANTYTVAFDANGGEGEMPSQTMAYDVIGRLSPNAFAKFGYDFVGWATNETCEAIFGDGEQVLNLSTVDGAMVNLYAVWAKAAPVVVKFVDGALMVDEGNNAEIRVFGGNVNVESSVKVHLTWNSAVAADVDLANAQVTRSPGLNVPVTLEWEKGEVGEKVITIPVKADMLVEGEEMFTLQLAAANGVALGEPTVCTVRIADAQWPSGMTPEEATARGLAALPSGATAIYAPRSASGSYQKEDVLVGYFTKKDKMGNVTAKAMPGYVFMGWVYTSNGKMYSTKTTVADKLRKSKNVQSKFSVAYYLRGLAYPANGGKVTESGTYAAGKMVTLKATPNKYWTFEGWFVAGAVTSAAASARGCVSTAKSLTVAVTNELTYLAMFKPYSKVTVSIDDNSGGTVKGAGSYLKGKTITLKATPKKGYAFCGWFDADGNLISLNANYEYKVTADDLALSASFKKESALVRPVLMWGDHVVDAGGTGGSPEQNTQAVRSTNLMVGVCYSAKLEVKGESAVLITKMTGLPKGLTYKSGQVSGVPTTNKVYTAKVTVALKSNAKKTWTYSVELNVAALPTWAVGTFKGPLYDAEGEGTASKGMVTLTVGKTGKVSGKFVSTTKKSYSFTASSFKVYGEDGVLRTQATMKYGMKPVTVEIAVGLDGETSLGFAEVGSMVAPFSGQTAVLAR